MNKFNFSLYLTLLVIIGVLIYLLVRKDNNSSNLAPIIKTDTITFVKTDTIKTVQPVKVSEIITRIDTIYVRDTIVVPIPISQKYYRENDYEAWVSGYKPNLDSIRVFKHTEVVTITNTEKVYIKPKKWGIGAQIGYGWNGNKFSPYVGIGIQRTIVSF